MSKWCYVCGKLCVISKNTINFVFDSLQDQVNAYTCHCTAGYYGAKCEINRDDCASTPCLNDATCIVSSWHM